MPTLNWIGKEAVVRHHKEVPFRLLEPVPELSLAVADGGVDSEADRYGGNLIVQGDNLHALKALLPRYAGKVKCIYIDPPYNTGNEGWVYNDNVNSPEIRRWLGEVVGKEGETLDRHDRWLCMMYPRLLLLKQFLRDDGIIFISIDDIETSLLRIVSDEIFGARNFIATLVWNTEGNTDNQFDIKVNHEYVLTYVKDSKFKSQAIGNVVDPNTRADSNLWKGIADNNINKNNEANPPAVFTIPAGFPSSEASLFYSKKDVDDRFFEETRRAKLIPDWIRDEYGIEKISGLPVKIDDLVVEDSRVVKPCRVYGGFANRRKLELFAKNGFKPIKDEGGPIEFYVNANAAIRYRRAVEAPSNILSVLRGLGTTERMRGELSRMGIKFDYPKPVDLVAYLLRIGAEDKDSIVMDSFAGSGTTAHATLLRNNEDGGKRQFILVEIDRSVCETITGRRTRLISEGYRDSNGAVVNGLGGYFQFCRLSAEPLFSADGQIRQDVRFAQLAEFVWFAETGSGYSGAADSPLLGVHEGRAIYLLYNGILKDLTDVGGNVLTAAVLAALPPFAGPKVIYAAANRLGARTAREGISFKQTPYALEV